MPCLFTGEIQLPDLQQEVEGAMVIDLIAIWPGVVGAALFTQILAWESGRY